jgi:hypothetical protein
MEKRVQGEFRPEPEISTKCTVFTVLDLYISLIFRKESSLAFLLPLRLKKDATLLVTSLSSAHHSLNT